MSGFTGFPGAYVFSWEVYCREGGSSELVSSYGNFTNSSTAVLGVRSTPDECLNQVVCQAWDDGDTHTHHTFTNDNVTGTRTYVLYVMSRHRGNDTVSHLIGRCRFASVGVY